MRRAGARAARGSSCSPRCGAVAGAESARIGASTDLLYAPPTRVHCWRRRARRRIVHPLRLVSRLERRFDEDRSTHVPLRWFTRRRARDRRSETHGAPLLLLGADALRPRHLLAPAARRARDAGAGRRSPRCCATLSARSSAAWPATPAAGSTTLLSRVSEFVLVLPAIYVALALRAVMPLVLPPSTVFAAAARHLRAARLADRRPRRARDRRSSSASATTRSPRARAGRAARAHADCVICCPPPAAISARRPRCCCRRSSWPKPRCRTSASGFPTRRRRGARCCRTRRTSRCSATRRGRWRPRPRSSWSCSASTCWCRAPAARLYNWSHETASPASSRRSPRRFATTARWTKRRCAATSRDG